MCASLFYLSKNRNFKCDAINTEWRRRLTKDVLSDATITLTGYYPSKHYPEPLRLVRFWDAEQGGEFSFLTNAFHLSSLQVA